MFKKLIVVAQLSLSLQASAEAPVQGAALVLPDNFIRVTIGDNDPTPAPDTRSRNYRRPKPEDDVRQLKGRVRTLESAVRQLQEEIYYLRYAQREQREVAPPVVQEKSNRWFCSLTSDFNRTYSGRGDTEIEGRTRALNACQDKESGTFCSDKKVRCEEAR